MIQVGVDIEDISRFENKTLEKDSHFLNKIFTKKELDYCFSNSMPAKHLAARFCAKEAVVKALSSILEKNISYSNIEILKKENGAPYVNLIGCSENIEISISLSHDREKAIAFAAAEKKLKI